MSASATVAASAISAVIKPAIADIYQYCKSKVGREIRSLTNQKTLDEIVRQVGRLDQIRTILKPAEDVSLRQIYYPARVVDYNRPAGSQPGIAVRNLHEMPIQNYIVEGTIGQGKTCFLKHLALSEVSNGASPENRRIPIFVELRNIEDTLENLIAAKLKSFSSTLSFKDFKAICTSGKLVLLLDAFDEVPTDLHSKVVLEISEIAKVVPRLQIVVTTRPGTPISTCAGFKIIKLEELRSTDHKFFLAKVLGDSKVADRIIDEVRSSGVQVSNLVTTPLLLTLLGLLYRAEHRIPPTIHEFYQHLFDTLFYRHDRMKEGFERDRLTDLSESDFKSLFEAFCFYSRVQSLGAFDKDAFRQCVEEAKQVRSIRVDADEYREDCVKSLCLLQEEGLRYHFIHRSVQEYYAASFVRHSEEAFAKRWYSLLHSKGRCSAFAQELAFLEEIDRGRLARFLWIPCFEAACKVNGSDLKADRKAAIASVLQLFAVTLFEAVDKKDRRIRRPVVLLPIVKDDRIRDFLFAAIRPALQRAIAPADILATNKAAASATFDLELQMADNKNERMKVSAIRLDKFIQLSTKHGRIEQKHENLVKLLDDKCSVMLDAIAAEKRKLDMLKSIKPKRASQLVRS
ncbi:NACHT domain-containing protein [Reyranella massiliensis]|uniref:NACHT domain-containing protein n=1 Tax=Reyranella massiliensis TaxID=445220 RepID=UPI0002D82B50|nr:NACHT domain-containing protein [Reyranella massiliensis]